MKYSGLFLLAFWLITNAVLDLGKFHFPYEKIVMPVLEFSSGVMLFLSLIKSKFGDIGLLLLSIWLILHGSVFIFHVRFAYSDMALSILAIVSGFFIIIRK